MIKRSEMMHGMSGMSSCGQDDDSDSCSTASMGKNSDCSEESLDEEDSEVKSLSRGPLDTMDALEEALPRKKGISKFYSGKSKSFTSLSDATSLNSIEEIVKPENPYNKKGKNLRLHGDCADMNQLSSRKDIHFGTSNRSIGYCQSSFPGKHDFQEGLSTSPFSGLPPLHPQGRTSTAANESSSCPLQQNPPCRSFSLSDLQYVAEKASDMSQFVVFSGNKCNQLSQDSSFDSFSQHRKVEERSW